MTRRSLPRPRRQALGLLLLGLTTGGPALRAQPAPPIAADAPSQQVSTPGAPGRPGTAGLNPLGSLDLSKLDAFKGRPLFSASRRPPALSTYATPTAPVAAMKPAPALQLVGIVAGVDTAIAMLRRAGEGPSLSLKVGDMVEAWRVHAIAPDRVVLREGEREHTYRLFASGRTPEPASAPRQGSSNPPGFVLRPWP